MDNKIIYLSGGITNLSHDERWGWRSEVRKKIMDNVNFYGYDFMPIFFNPLMHYDLEYPNGRKNEHEVFELETHYLRKSDLVIVNFNDKASIGVAMELAIAKENRIPVAGLNEDGVELHPWLVECTTRMCDTFDELIDYVACQHLMA